MGLEIERKFLTTSDAWREQAERSTRYRQGYLNEGDAVSVRVRVAEDRANLNFKSATLDIARVEFEYEIPVEDAQLLLDMATGSVVEKTRHFVPHGSHLWEVDVFEGANSGLIVAEVELASKDESFERPDWVGSEVSDDPRYFNVYLARNPYSGWPPQTRQV